MKDMIETRELFVLDGPDGLIRGTYHKPHNNSPDRRSDMPNRKCIGVLFVNGMSPTKAANGDSAVYFADCFAQCGYPSFRLDFPGFGDSDGDPPAKLAAFIDQGGYASIASAKIAELVERFNLSGVVLVGHCAGTVSALYAAAANRKCKGLVLMAPYFHLPQVIRPKSLKVKLLSQHKRPSRLFATIDDCWKKVRVYFRGSVPPENANLPLLLCWKELASRGLPILILNKPSRQSAEMRSKVGAFDYLEYVLRVAGRSSRVVAILADGTDHSFSNRQGRAAVRQHVGDWLGANFPSVKCTDSSVDALLRRSGTATITVGIAKSV